MSQIAQELESAFESFGGAPLRGVFDNPKTIVNGKVSQRARSSQVTGWAFTVPDLRIAAADR